MGANHSPGTELHLRAQISVVSNRSGAGNTDPGIQLRTRTDGSARLDTNAVPKMRSIADQNGSRVDIRRHRSLAHRGSPDPSTIADDDIRSKDNRLTDIGTVPYLGTGTNDRPGSDHRATTQINVASELCTGHDDRLLTDNGAQLEHSTLTDDSAGANPDRPADNGATADLGTCAHDRAGCDHR